MIPLKDNLRCSTFPLVTLVIILLNCFAFFIELMVQGSSNADSFFGTYTMVPAKVVHAFASADPHLMLVAVISIFTAMFLHGGWMHIIGNMVFLQCFGRGVENRMGRVNYAVFYLLSGLAAAMGQLLSDPSSMVPTLGASGAIAGVLGAYLLFWPKAQVKGILLPMPLVFTVNAFWFLLFWIAEQGISIVSSIGKVGAGDGVAYWEHVGGFALGLIVACLWKLYKPNSDVCEIPVNCPCPPKEDKAEEPKDEE